MPNIYFLFFIALQLVSSPTAAGSTDKQEPIPMPLIGAYLLDKAAEISLARSAAPSAVSSAAAIMVLTHRGYEYASSGTNGFVCIVQRGWMNDLQDIEFGSPKLLSPMCLNPAGVRLYLPFILKRTELALSRSSKATIKLEMAAAFNKGTLRTNETGAMCYMMSKDGDFGAAGHPIPHIMFFTSRMPTADWGASLPGSPIIGYEDSLDRITVFIIPVSQWSDGTPASTSNEHKH